MSTDTLLVINDTDFSDYITEKDLSVKYVPVFDDSAEFVSMDGSRNKKLLGFTAYISVDFPYLDDGAASALSAAASEEKITVSYPFPNIRTGDFTLTSLTLEPVREAGGERIWAAFLSMRSETIKPDGL